MDWFTESANRYQLTGKPPEQLCEHNATVALSLNRHQVLIASFCHFLAREQHEISSLQGVCFMEAAV